MSGDISRAGVSAEDLFCLVTGSTKAANSGDGDAVFEGHLVEVKALNTGGRWIVNQLRPVKYLPAAIYYAPSQQWYVIPAHCLVLRASTSLRGQHTAIPYESFNWDIFNDRGRFRVPDPAELSLSEKVRHAIHESDVTYSALKDLMSASLRDAEALAGDIHGRVWPLLKSLKVSYPEPAPSVRIPVDWEEIVRRTLPGSEEGA